MNPTPVRLPYAAGSRCPPTAAPRQPAARRLVTPKSKGGGSLGRTRLILFGSIGAFLLASGAPSAFADDHNPIGVTGAFEGVITTGCAYNVLNHNARREIDDIVVPGSIGKYPLKMTRYYNSRRTPGYGLLGAGWTHEYLWVPLLSVGKFQYPNGSEQDSSCFELLGVSDGWVPGSPTCDQNGCRGDFRLADGGTVHFDDSNGYFRARTVKDPYGQTTTLTSNNSGYLTRVTEPGGRYLQFNYSQVNGVTMLSGVDAYDGVSGHPRIDWVVYHYTSISPGGQYGPPANCLTSVDYSDGQHAYYTYQEDNVPEHPGPPCPCVIKVTPLLRTCRDVRYKGAMRHICYEYPDNGAHGAIIAERYSLNGSTNGPRVSKIDPPAPSPISTDPDFDTTYTETRGDTPTRTFNYTPLHLHRFPEDSCPTASRGPPQQFLLGYTDFQNHTTQLGYDASWYVNSVTDANNHTTGYTRGPPPPNGIGQILRITHPGDYTHIDYTYQAEPGALPGHYLETVTDEGAYVTTYHRSATSHQIYRTDYPDTGYETFAYNPFGQLLTHLFRNGAYESFAYDTRGLLTDKWNPKQNAIPAGNNDPYTHYDYYTSGPWTDRVQKMTLPANVSSLQASETYEYDRALGADGVTNSTGGVVAGRGLVTKITHADNTYQLFGYDAYGNKRWEENELRQRTNYTYDDYNRLLTAKNPLNQTTTYTYNPTNGTGSSYLHTTNNADTITTPTGILTSNVYDENFRKISTTVGSSTTSFLYDNVGNLTWVTDPLSHQTYNTYDVRNRKLTSTEAYGTNLAATTTWHYDGVSNVYKIDRPDATSETKSYDALNRLLTDTVPQSNSVNLTTTFNYNPSGTINWVKDANNHTTTFAYDASDQKTTMTYPGNTQSQSWTYDDAHNLVSRTTVGGKTESFTYDIRNRKKTMTYTTAGQWIEWAYYIYDAASRLVEGLNGTGVWNTNISSDVTLTYNAAGRLIVDRQYPTGLPGGARSVNYFYDDDGKVNRMYASGGNYDYTFSYDEMGRFEKMFVTNSSQLFQYYYDDASNETKRSNLSDNVAQIYTRDALNRIGERDLNRSGTVFSSETYTYDTMSRLRSVSREDGKRDNFAYYLDGELVTAQYGLVNNQNPTRSVNYTLDKAGNRTIVTDTVSGNASYTPNNLNQYTAAGAYAVWNGDEHEITDYHGMHYDYLKDEHVIEVSNIYTNDDYQLSYDALGRCVKRTLNITGQPSVTTYYIYDGEKPVVEYASTGAVSARNLYGKGIDEILMRDDVGNNWTIYYQQDHEGSVTHVTNSSGGVVETFKYDVFGAPNHAPAHNNRFLFTGREYNAIFGFYEYRARAYNPTLGRFMSEDPKGFAAGDYNLFRFCHNDPLDLSDPMGTEITLPPGPTHATQAMEMAYNYVMAAAQWQMSNLMNSASGAIGIGMAGYQAMQTLGSVMQSPAGSKAAGYPVSRANTDPHPPIIQSSADPNGLVHIDPGQRSAFGEGFQIVKANTDSSEGIIGITYNATTHGYGVTSTIVRGQEFQGGQTGQLPPLPKGNYAYAGQVHSHTNRSGFSGNDILWGNQNRLPIGLYSGNRSQLYVPLFNSNPNTSSVQGVVLPFGD